MKNFLNDLSFSASVAGIISVIVGFTSSAIIVFQAASAAGATKEMASSWLGVLCLGMGVLTIYLSNKYKAPVMFAWSTPGAALLIAGLHGEKLNEVIGAFIFSSLLIFLSGVTGLFEKIIKRIPMGVASAMLAGLLLHFAFDVFIALQAKTSLVLIMFLTYIIGKKFFPRLNIAIVFSIGILIAWMQGLLLTQNIELILMIPIFTMPSLKWQVLFNIGLPLFIVSMTSQNMTGLAVMRTYNYKPEISKLISYSGIVNFIIAPFGGFTLNLAALTAAICMGPESHSDPSKRYTAAITSGAIYIIIGLFSGTIVGLFNTFPKELIMAIAGLALMNTITNGISTAVLDLEDREASMITFFITASGLSIMGIGSAFWGIIAGILVGIFLKSESFNKKIRKN